MARRPHRSERLVVSFWLLASVHRDLKRSLKREGITAQQLMTEMVEDWLQRHPPPPPPDNHPRMF